MGQEYGKFDYAYEGGAATDDAPDIAKEREINADHQPQVSPSGSKGLTKSTSKNQMNYSMSKLPGATGGRIAHNYQQQTSRIQITSDWRDTCIQQEVEEINKLEKFMEIERARAHHVAQSLLIKQQEVEQKRENIVRLKKEQQEEKRQRNLEMAAKAGKKMEEMDHADAGRYERK